MGATRLELATSGVTAGGLLLTKTPKSHEQWIIKRFSYDLVFASVIISVAFFVNPCRLRATTQATTEFPFKNSCN